jgi:hypothetical protein
VSLRWVPQSLFGVDRRVFPGALGARFDQEALGTLRRQQENVATDIWLTRPDGMVPVRRSMWGM